MDRVRMVMVIWLLDQPCKMTFVFLSSFGFIFLIRLPGDGGGGRGGGELRGGERRR
jgi:hypothetical protein